MSEGLEYGHDKLAEFEKLKLYVSRSPLLKKLKNVTITENFNSRDVDSGLTFNFNDLLPAIVCLKIESASLKSNSNFRVSVVNKGRYLYWKEVSLEGEALDFMGDAERILSDHVIDKIINNNKNSQELYALKERFGERFEFELPTDADTVVRGFIGEEGQGHISLEAFEIDGADVVLASFKKVLSTDIHAACRLMSFIDSHGSGVYNNCEVEYRKCKGENSSSVHISGRIAFSQENAALFLSLI